jgi:hypothetical protein
MLQTSKDILTQLLYTFVVALKSIGGIRSYPNFTCVREYGTTKTFIQNIRTGLAEFALQRKYLHPTLPLHLQPRINTMQLAQHILFRLLTNPTHLNRALRQRPHLPIRKPTILLRHEIILMHPRILHKRRIVAP